WSASDGVMRIWIILEGQGVLKGDEAPVAFKRGEVLLLPAKLEAAAISITPVSLLEVRLP
ncbi:MAG TPA: hypothetical protein VGN88_09665, partial [Phycisphaerae bacterium]